MGMTRAANAWSRQPRTIASIVSLCVIVAGPLAAAEGDDAAIEGRWEAARKDLMLDIARCAQGYCGRLVTSDNRCDRTILTVVTKATSFRPSELLFEGDFAPPNAIRSGYKATVSVTTATAAKPASMVIMGDEVAPHPMRRTFPYRAVLTRVGEATCQSRTTS
jgi:hypothetical protein